MNDKEIVARCLTCVARERWSEVTNSPLYGPWPLTVEEAEYHLSLEHDVKPVTK